MTAASGVGVASYDWYMQNVHLVPYSWRQQLDILQRELQRATAALGLEETRNAGVSSQEPPATQVEYQARFDAAVDAFSTFIRQHDVLDLPDYALGALSRRVGPLAPPEARDLFTRVEYADALPMRCHGTHWLDLARMAHEPHPSPIRRSPLLYNIWDSRAEGLATGFEEMMLEAGLFDSRPRARELVYVLLANRAARAMGDLRMHSNEFTIEQAVDYAVAHTPRGWLKRDGGTVWFDEQLYLQQPGYGTSYVIGKVQIERLLAEDRRLSGDRFTLRRFFDRFLGAGMIPVSLIEWEMTGRGPQ
jgi:hypothetical protein